MLHFLFSFSIELFVSDHCICLLQALFKALGLNDNDYKFGLTKVFFRPGKVSILCVGLLKLDTSFGFKLQKKDEVGDCSINTKVIVVCISVCRV